MVGMSARKGEKGRMGIDKWMEAGIMCLLCCLKFGNTETQCDPDTVKNADAVLVNHPGMKEYIIQENAEESLGTITFVNWQDPVLFLKSPNGKACEWKMNSTFKAEMDRFNGKNHKGSELHADPVNARAYYRLISCKQEDCTQFFNVFVRPVATPTFPVQIYEGSSKDIKCDLKLMMRPAFNIEEHKPPFTFEWTGPRDCVESNWNSYDAKSCVRYKYFKGLPGCAAPFPCTFALDAAYINAMPNGIKTDTGGYADTTVTIREWDSTLRISKASEEHDGKWRCIVYDQLNISSHPDDESLKMLNYNGLTQLGIVDVHCKNIYIAMGVPGGIIILLFIVIVVSINCCKHYPDYKVSVS